jgi:membrane protein
MSKKEDLRQIYNRLNIMTRGGLGILALSLERFSEARGAATAASLAYYALFSIFPFFLALIASASFVLEEEIIFSQVTEIIGNFLPVSETLIEDNLQTILALRGPVRIIGFIGLVWAGTGVFSSVFYNVSLAWPDTKPSNFIRNRLAGLSIITLVIVLLSAYMFFSTVSTFISRFDPANIVFFSPEIVPVQSFITQFLSWGSKVVLFFLLFLWAPNTKVPWRAALVGAMVSALGWDLATAGFTWYLTSGIATYELVYGSLGAIVALMLWFYIISLVILYGAHLGGAITTYYHSGSSEAEAADTVFE